MKTLTMLLLAVPLAASCGAEVLVDVPAAGAGSTGGMGGAGGAGGAGGGAGTGGETCDALLADLAAKILAARACAWTPSYDHCDGSALVVDGCSCDVVLNEDDAPAVAAASAASTAAVAAGCTGVCDHPCPSKLAWTTCSPNPAGGSWMCTPAAGD